MVSWENMLGVPFSPCSPIPQYNSRGVLTWTVKPFSLLCSFRQFLLQCFYQSVLCVQVLCVQVLLLQIHQHLLWRFVAGDKYTGQVESTIISKKMCWRVIIFFIYLSMNVNPRLASSNLLNLSMRVPALLVVKHLHKRLAIFITKGLIGDT